MAEKQVKRPTTSKELLIKQLVEGNGIKDRVFEIYGPLRMAGSIVWELWVYDKDDEIATRFVEEIMGSTPKVHDKFQQLAVEIDIRHEQVLKQAFKDEWDQKKELIELQTRRGVVVSQASNERYAAVTPLALASVGVVSAIAVFAVLALRGGDDGKYAAILMFGTIVASACTFIFGKTIFPKALKGLLGA